MAEVNDALVKWVNTFEGVAECPSLESLSDGLVLNDILCTLAPSHFAAGSLKQDVAGNNVLKETNIKRLLLGLKSYYADELSQRIDTSTINTGAIAAQGDADELRALVELVLGIAVQCENRQEHIHSIMELDEDTQHNLMVVIQDIMERGRRLSTGGAASPVPTGGGGMASSAEVEDALAEAAKARSERDEAYARLADTKAELDASNLRLEEKEIEVKELREREASAAKSRSAAEAAAIEAAKAETDRLRKALEDAERESHTLDGRLKAKDAEIADFARKVDELTEATAETTKLRDELDVVRARAEQADKFERAMNKYKEKLGPMADLKLTIQSLESENKRLLDTIAEQEASLKKMTALSTQVSTYRDKVASLESKNTTLNLDLERADGKVARLKDTLESLTAAKDAAEAQVITLTRELEDLRLDGATGGGAEVMGDILSGDLTAKVKELEDENRKLRASAGASDSEQIATLSELVETAQSARAAAEEEYKASVKRCHDLEDKVEEMEAAVREAKAAAKKMTLQAGESGKMIEKLAEKDRAAAGLQAALIAAEDRATAAESELAETAALLTQAQSDVVELKTKCSVMGMDKEELVTELTATLKTQFEDEVASAEAALRDLKSALDAKEAERAALADQLASAQSEIESVSAELETTKNEVNSLLKAKDRLQTDNIALKDDLLAAERRISAAEASVASSANEIERAKEAAAAAANTGPTADEAAKTLLEQQKQLHEFELLKAEHEKERFMLSHELERLKSQVASLTDDKDRLGSQLTQAKAIIQDMTTGSDTGVAQAEFEHQLRVLEAKVKDRENEVEFYKRNLKEARENAKKEERLMVSAFYGLGLELQRIKAPSRMIGGEPRSWLGQQRRRVSPIRRGAGGPAGAAGESGGD